MSKEAVVLLHGMLRTHRHMAPLARRLEAEGFATHNVDYPSRTLGMEALLAQLHTTIAPLHDAPKLHFVGYSMGGLLVRAYVHRFRPANLGTVVQLAPPNHGSEVADRLKPLGVYRWLYGPAGQELTTDQSAIAHLFGHVDYPLGILAGTRCLDPFCAFLLKGEHDGKVTVASTKLEGMRAHKTIRATHTFFPTHPEVMANTAHFLKTQSFAD